MAKRTFRNGRTVVTVDDTRLRRLLKKLDTPVPDVKVGVLAEDGGQPYEGGATVALVAAVHEYGLGVPRRSWLRDWVEPNKREVQKRLRKALYRAAIQEKTNLSLELGRLGAWASGEIKVRISRVIGPALSSSTVNRKGSSIPLIDTGQLRNAISWVVTRLKGR